MLKKTTLLLLFFLTQLFFLTSEEHKKTICLNMIVKNESHVIERCLNSVKGIINYWVIVDTGSTDGTQDIIKNCLKDIPGELIERPWKDFAYNRTEALKLAETKADYLLFMDADDWLEFEPGFKVNLTAGCYLMQWNHKNNFSYYKPQLVKASLDWKWSGVIHEYLHSDKIFSEVRLKNVKYMYGADGHRSQDPEKHLKAVIILEEALKTEPDNTRYQFYLAQSLCGCKKFKEALEAYKKRVCMKEGWYEETFQALLMIGILKQILKYPIDDLIESYMRAHEFAPYRSEPVYFLADLYNQKGDYTQAYAIIKKWENTPQILLEDGVKFDWTWKYGLDLQCSLCAYYLGYTQEFVDKCDLLLANENLPDSWRILVESNRSFAPASTPKEPQKLSHQTTPAPKQINSKKMSAFKQLYLDYNPFILKTLAQSVCPVLRHENCKSGYFHLCTVANFEHPNLIKLRESCSKQGLDLIVLGMGLPYLSNGTKLVHMASYLNTLPDDDIVMFVDAFDVLVVGNIQTILEKFLAMNAPIVMAAETNCYPYPTLKEHFADVNSPFKFINTGGWIGYAKPLKKWLKALSPEQHELEDDQAQITLHYIQNKQKPPFVMDHDASLFLCLWGLKDDEVTLQDGVVKCLPTHSEPSIIHANGNAFRTWNRIYEEIVSTSKTNNEIARKVTAPLEDPHPPGNHWNLLHTQHEMLNYITNFPLNSYTFVTVPAVRLTYRRDPFVFYDPIEEQDDNLRKSLRYGYEWEPHLRNLIYQHAKPESVAVDIGAHIGVHTVSMSDSVGPSGVVVAIEPKKKYLRELIWNLKQNRIHNVACCWEKADTSSFEIDSLQLSNVSLVKVDVDGMEIVALEGSKETILREKPVILIKIPQVGAHREQVTRQLEGLGYKVELITGNDFIAFSKQNTNQNSRASKPN